MKRVSEELGVPKKHLKETSKQQRYLAVVHKSWLKSLIKHLKLIDFIEKSGEIWPSPEEEISSSWMTIFITVINKKNCKVIPLPRIRPVRDEEPFLFPQLMQYIAHTNHVGLWKAAYKKYYASKQNKETLLNLTDYNKVLRDVISRIYGCPIINTCDPNASTENSKQIDMHLNIMPVVCAVETAGAIFLLHVPYLEYNLNDCVTFSPAILDNSYTKSLFIVYQLLNVLKDLHERSLTLGDISLNDIFANEDMWLYIFPQIESNLYEEGDIKARKGSSTIRDCQQMGHVINHKLQCEYCGLQAYDKVKVDEQTLEELCHLWIFGQISNFTYVSALNKLSGRVLGDPNCHYVFPWVTDFSSRCGKNWRDLKKSKYRLNKGDHQLDLTYGNSLSQVPHHVSDVLSPITYYVYTARRTPKSVLCKNVRTVWVPAEYPSSIQRIQEWTPDECIPEFYTNPNIFRSIHDDMDDLGVPSWASGPEDFVERHRKALESPIVSEKLHHWIDLTFGYKLSGVAAVKARNVCLNLVDGHENLTKSGLVQLFSHPHPPRNTSSPYWSKIPPKISSDRSPKQRRKCRRNSSTTVETTNSEEEKCAGDSGHRLSSAGMSKMLSRSRSSLHEETAGKASRSPSNTRSDSFVPNKFKQSDSPGVLSQASLNPNGDTYFLPKDYKPEQALEILEKKHAFFSKTFAGCRTDSLEKNTNDLVPEPAGSFEETYKTKWGEFSSNFPKENQNGKFEDQIVCNFVDIISTRRVKELKVLGCLIVEIFMAKQLKCLGSSSRDLSLDSRIENCIAMTRHSDNCLPPCISYIVDLLLRPDDYDRNDPFSSTHPPITPAGLPPPTARLLLEPLLHHPLPFSRHQPSLYRLLADLKRFESVASELDVLYHFDCAGGEMCAQYEALEKTRILLQRNIAECQVKGCVGELEGLLGEVDTNTESEVIGIILPYIKQLMENPPTSVLAAWYLFEPLSRVLGPRKSAKYLLPPLLKLYENEPDHSHLPYLGKIARLYHHSFLLCLMVRLGLRCFLDKFVVALVEAVGGYKDRELVDFVLHDHSGRVAKRASHLKGIEAEEGERSSSEESNSGRGERESAVEEVFELEEEKNSEEQIKFLIDHLQLNVASELTFNHSIEEASEANTSEESGVRSPTIPIPTSKTTLSHISCEVGSKKSEKSELELDFEVSELPKVSARGSESPRVSARGKPKISETSSDSLLWLSHRLGPLLTAKYLSRNLLKMLALCYIGRENLTGCVLAVGGSLGGVSIAGGYVVGDEAAGKVLECLSSISGLYGEQIILYQYIPYMTEMILLCKKRLTPNLEGGLISCLALLKYIIPYFTDVMLMDQLQDVILKNILHPIVRLLNSTEHTFPSGYFSRNTLARKYLDVIYVLSIRIGTDMTKKYLVVPALQRFFLIFDKVYDRKNDMYVDKVSLAQPNIDPKIENEKPTPDSPSSEKLNDDCSLSEETNLTNETLKEIKEVFTPELAYTAYLPFINLVGSGFLEVSLKNHENVRNLCQEYEESLLNSGGQDKLKLSNFPRSQSITSTSSIGSNVAMIGNRIDVQPEVMDNLNMDLLSLVRNRVESSTRHLRGNWLAYWESEIGRSEKNRALNFKQIKLQTFVGHTQSVKCLYALDNENSFLSGSRDKTVKLWSLRSQGDGSTTSNCQWTYSAHRKSILSITFVESLRLVASCDSVVHIWDPFMGANLGSLESAKYAPVNVLRSMPAPSTLVFAATTDGTIKIIDTRLLDYVQEIKISLNPSGLIRCLAVAPCGTWVAAGQSSGAVTVLDTRTGLVVSNWRAHESEVLQLAVGDEDLLISTSLDQNVCVWSVADGKFKFQMRGTTEPVHCLNVNNNELISGTTANRIGVHCSIAPDAAFSNNKLRTDTFRGLLTSMDYLPLNRLLLLGADTGNINLLC